MYSWWTKISFLYNLDYFIKHEGVYNLYFAEIGCHDIQWNIPKKRNILLKIVYPNFIISSALKHY